MRFRRIIILRTFSFYFIAALLLLNNGCWLPQAVKDTKQQMDITEQVQNSLAAVWDAALRAVEDLEIIVEDKSFDGKKGIIKGHKGELKVIQIYIEQLEPQLTLVGVQARKNSFVLALQKENAKPILDHIRECLK